MPITEYHRLARTPQLRWWKSVLGTLFIVAGGLALAIGLIVVAAIVAVLAGRPLDADGLPTLGPLPDLALTFLAVAALLPPTFAAARWIQGRPAGTLSSVTGRLRWPWMMACFGVAVVAVGILLGASAFLPAESSSADGGESLVGWPTFLVSALVAVHVVPVQAAAEEYVIRGWLMQAIGAYFKRPWLPIAVQALVFAALHGWGTPWGFADLVVFGVVAGWLTVWTGGLEAAIALHVANNLLGTVLLAAFGDLSTDETAADMPWQLVAVDVPVLIAYGMIVVFLKRRLLAGRGNDRNGALVGGPEARMHPAVAAVDAKADQTAEAGVDLAQTVSQDAQQPAVEPNRALSPDGVDALRSKTVPGVENVGAVGDGL
ncbi:lysostaphin resistance A-like protein [Actinoplanes sp. CA-142083]|uniref:CPBP family intramembrane glutamic endopeptidase n=1 Tax=Actinoplanes sp. CA-142083 TaxID=3239903 RepID=UPI003D94E4AA